MKAVDLVSSLDVQEFGLGKYVVKWAREGESRATTTTFELSPLKVKSKFPNSTINLGSGNTAYINSTHFEPC